MALIVVGGQSKHVGKTTLVCEIIRHFVSARWTAAKITSHFHQPEECVPVATGAGWQIWEQRAGDAHTDTARYLAAGAVRSLLVSAEREGLVAACSALKTEISADGNAIVESTASAQILAPDMFLLVVDPGSQELKTSAREQLLQAHALVVGSRAQRIRAVDNPGHVPVVQALEAGIDAVLINIIEGLLRTPVSELYQDPTRKIERKEG